MKLGVFTVLFSNLSFEEMLDKVVASGLQAVEIGTGGYVGDAHCPLDELLEDEEKRKEYLKKISDRGLTISSFSCHNNPLSTDKEFAAKSQDTIIKSIKLASLCGVPVVTTFSGVAGDSEDAKSSNWPVAPWPSEFSETCKWQWENKLIPYWKEVGKFAEEHNVKIALELHGGFLVHTPHTMLKLREATCDAIGANLDPSHMWWQGIDPVAAIRILGEANAIHHFHAKDTYINQENVNRYGLLDMQSYGDIKTRAWIFRSVGCGHGLEVWSDMMSTLRTYGYDFVVSIEHEDALMSIDEGFERAVANLQEVLIKDPMPNAWWL